MSAQLIAFVGLIYLGVAGNLFHEKKWGLAIAFLGYAFSNVGLYLAAKVPAPQVIEIQVDSK